MNAYLYQYIIATPLLVVQIILALVIIMMIAKKDSKLRKHAQKYGMLYGLIVALAALVGSLGFSEGYHFAPCKLCWIQRIFHYPHIILFAVAMKFKDARVWTYSIWLSVIGGLVAGYQVLIQFSPSLAESSFCTIVPAAESCSDILIQPYGYLSIPVMSLTLFVCLIVLFLLQKQKNA